MGQAWWKVIDTVRSTTHVGPGYVLLFEKGVLHFKDGRPSEPGYRFIWEVNGKRQARPARIDDLAEIDALTAAGWAKGWR